MYKNLPETSNRAAKIANFLFEQKAAEKQGVFRNDYLIISNESKNLVTPAFMLWSRCVNTAS